MSSSNRTNRFILVTGHNSQSRRKIVNESVTLAIKLLSEYKEQDLGDVLKPGSKFVSQEEYLQEYFAQNDCSEELQDVAVELYFKVTKYRKYLNIVLKELFPLKVLERCGNYAFPLVLLYLLIAELHIYNKDKMKDLLISIGVKKVLPMLAVLKKPNTLRKLYESGCQIWDVDYVKEFLQNVIDEPLFKDLHEALVDLVRINIKTNTKRSTVPRTPKCLSRPKKYKPLPEPIPVSNVKIRPKILKKLPKLIPTDFDKKWIENARLKNQEKAKKLYEEAQKNAFKCSNPEKSERFKKKVEKIEREQREIFSKKIKIKKIVPKEVMSPKKTAAVILREGARLLKKEQEEIKKYEDLASGGFNTDSISELEEAIKEETFRKRLADIEKKHLEGLLSYEEALLARQKCLKKKKEIADEFRKEKENWIKQLEEWKNEEQIRIEENVKKGKSYERGAKEAMEMVKEEKHKIALETMEESKILKERWLKEKEEDLKKKVQLIKEIKALQELSALRIKQAEYIEPTNMGFLCTMSIVELKERLFLLQIELREELERKKADIKMRKECRKEIIKGYQELIETHQKIVKEQKQRVEDLESDQKKLAVRSCSLESLRRKLYEKRGKRLRQQIWM